MLHSPLQCLIIGKVWPEPDSSAAGQRMMQLIEQFRQQEWDITFASAAAESAFGVNLGSYGITPKNIKLNDASFDDFVAGLKPDIVLFDRFMTEEQFGWRVAEQCPDALRVLDTEDLHCLRQARYQSWKKGEKADIRSLDVAKREIASILRCDLSLMISSYEMKLLEDVFRVDESLLLHLPFMLDELTEATIHSWPSFTNRQQLVSIGNFLHEPNWNAVLYLKEDIWPMIRKELPEAELHIYGAYPSQKVEQLHNESDGFLVKGRAEDAKSMVAKSRVLLAPLRFGAGLKGKLIEAMQCGTPSVTTAIGAEAMHADLPWPGVICNEPEAFAQAAVELYQNQEKWRKAQRKAMPIINQLYDKGELGKKLIRRLGEIRESLDTHRKENFMGQMLMHHTAASTRFMSKWIEEKNRITDL